jgi:hypothetical protein
MSNFDKTKNLLGEKAGGPVTDLNDARKLAARVDKASGDLDTLQMQLLGQIEELDSSYRHENGVQNKEIRKIMDEFNDMDKHFSEVRDFTYRVNVALRKKVKL